MKKIKQMSAVILAVVMVMVIVAVPISFQAGAVSIPGEAVKFNGHYYLAFDESKSWTEAEAYCESLGGHLVTITSEAEQAFVFETVQNRTKNLYWLGGSDAELEGEWKWITGEPWNYTNWSMGNPVYGADPKPDCDRDEDDFLQMYLSDETGNPPGTWNDDSEGEVPDHMEFYTLNHVGFICEWDNLFNLGEETYSFKNYGDADSKGGHCFGMSVTSSAYYNSLLNMNSLAVFRDCHKNTSFI